MIVAYSDEKWLYYKFSLHHSYNCFLKGWENTLFELNVYVPVVHTFVEIVWGKRGRMNSDEQMSFAKMVLAVWAIIPLLKYCRLRRIRTKHQGFSSNAAQPTVLQQCSPHPHPLPPSPPPPPHPTPFRRPEDRNNRVSFEWLSKFKKYILPTFWRANLYVT